MATWPPLNVVDSSAWLAYLADDSAAETFAEAIEDTRRLAVRLALEHRIPLADSIVYATAQASNVVVWTRDDDFDGLPGVRYVKKRGRGGR